ncbi:MAG TPA: tetratricopeptide repeat protein [Chthonomonadales bacterium]|nr:tetratricopeptide repeat protein [Chthonomonadales bacterium]
MRTRCRTAFPLLALAFLALLAGGRTHAQSVAVRFEQADGATVSDVVTIVARPTTAEDADIDRVDFRVGGQLAGSDTSTPYELVWDTLEAGEGRHTIEAVATDSRGMSATARITLIVDNQLGRGAEALAADALAAIRAGDLARAAAMARRALKVDADNLTAARALAAVHRERGEPARAVEVLMKATIPDSDTEARADLIAMHVAAGAASPEVSTFLEHARRAKDEYDRLLAARLAAIPDDRTPASAIKRGDLLAAARRWDAALQEYQKAGDIDTAPVEALNRVILASVYLQRRRDGERLLRRLTAERRADAVTEALGAFWLLRDHRFAEARQAAQPGVDRQQLPALIVAAYAEAGMRQGSRALALLEQARQIAPYSPEVGVLAARLNTDLISSRRGLMDVLARDPTYTPAYALMAFQGLLGRATRRLEEAGSLLDAGLRRDPSHPYALIGKAITLMMQDRSADAQPVVEALLRADSNAPDAYMVAATLAAAQDSDGVTDMLTNARRLNEELWSDAVVPRLPDLLVRVHRFRVGSELLPQSLYPAAAGAP